MTTTPISLRGRPTGFTLFELLVVIILMAAAAAVVMPSFIGGFGSLELETSARDLVTHMRQARTDAIARQEVRRVFLVAPEVPNEPFSYALTDEYGVTIRAYPLPRGIRFVESQEMLTTFSFYANGRSSGGELALVNESGKKLTILVDPITGFGKVQKKVLEQ